MLQRMYRVTLSAEQRDELQHRTRQVGIAPSTRDRLEMVRLADAGWSVPEIARHFGVHEQTARAWIKAFIAGGFDALTNKPRGGDRSAVTLAMIESVRAEIAKGDRIWSAAEIADWVAKQHGVRIGPGRMRVHLKRAKLSYQRTARSLRHKQQPEELDNGKAQLTALEKKGMLG